MCLILIPIIERTLENRIADIDRELKGEEKTINSLKIPDTEKIKQQGG